VIPPVLFSYHYLRSQKHFAQAAKEIVSGGFGELLVDSGAFSVHRLGKTIPLEEYVDFIKELNALGEVYGFIQLDVIGNKEGTRNNLKRMIDLGVRPMPVLTSDMDASEMSELVKVNEKICVAGGVSKFPGSEDWIKLRYLEAFKQSEEKAKIHGLGYVKWPEMLQLPLASVDSSSFSAGARYGLLMWFEYNERGNSTSVVHSKPWKQMVSKKWSDVPKPLRSLIVRCGVTPEDWLNETGMTRGSNAFSWLSGAYAYIVQSLVARRRGLRIFTAVGGTSMLQLFLGVSANMNEGLDGFDFHAAQRDCGLPIWGEENIEARMDLYRRASERCALIERSCIRRTMA
jgi:hypothetical protein